MSRGGPWTKNMWFSSLRLLACEEGRTLVKACKDWERMKKDHQIIPIEVQPVFWMIGWPGVGSCPERDLHCGAELLQKDRLSRRCHGCCHRAGVVLQVFDRSCLSGALQSAGPGESFGDQQPRDALEFGKVPDSSRRHQGGGAWCGDPGFRRRSAGSLHKTRQVRRILQTFLIHSTYSSAVVAHCLFDSGWHLQSKNYIENMHRFEDQ